MHGTAIFNQRETGERREEGRMCICKQKEEERCTHTNTPRHVLADSLRRLDNVLDLFAICDTANICLFTA